MGSFTEACGLPVGRSITRSVRNDGGGNLGERLEEVLEVKESCLRNHMLVKGEG